MGYSDVIVPPVIQRNVLENPGWYVLFQGRAEGIQIRDIQLDEGDTATVVARGQSKGSYVTGDGLRPQVQQSLGDVSADQTRASRHQYPHHGLRQSHKRR